MKNEARITRGPLEHVQCARLLADDRQLRAFDFDIDLANVFARDFDTPWRRIGHRGHHNTILDLLASVARSLDAFGDMKQASSWRRRVVLLAKAGPTCRKQLLAPIALWVIGVQDRPPAPWATPHGAFAPPQLRSYRWLLGLPSATVRKRLLA